jgi:hypothetical protein
MSDTKLAGGCLCGAVRIAMSGAPYRVGICHCLDCRKRQGGLFHASATFPIDAVTISGACGSVLFGRFGDEIGVNLGCLDAPNQLRPTYELWVIRREDWLPPFDVARRYQRDREGKGRSEP